MLDKSMHGAANRISQRVKPRRTKKYKQTNMQYLNRRGKQMIAERVPQIPDHIHRFIVAGHEPTDEMEAEAAAVIRAATEQLRELQIQDMRDRRGIMAGRELEAMPQRDD
jgi:hypothetical protein